MADKEERILCLKVDYKPFVYLPNPRDYKVPEDIYKIIIGGSMTKQIASVSKPTILIFKG